MNRLKGSRTEQNLLKSFAGESQARNRYGYFAGIARSEGYVQIADIFEETANQEREHAKRFFKFLEGGDLEITASFPAGRLGTTAENLLASANGEQEEHEVLYPQSAEVAADEGFAEIAAVWRAVRVAEHHHERRYRVLLRNLESGRFFSRDQAATWRCRNCGYLHQGTGAPDLCPACAHPKAHFEAYGEGW
jgi:rubrerythrin